MKKVVFVSDTWSPQVNGVARVQDAYAAELAHKGVIVVGIHPALFRSMPLPFYREIRLALFPYRSMSRLLSEEHPDAIHIMTEGPLGWAARRYCIRKHIPFTTSYHTHFHLYVEKRLRGLLSLVTLFLRRFHASAARTFVSTPTLERELVKLGFLNVTVIPFGVDTDFFMHRTNPNLPKLTNPVFVYVGRLAPEKSPEEFLMLDLPGTKLVIGDGPDRPKLERRYGDSNVIFAGYRRGHELVDWLSLGDVLVFPSRTETFGLVAIEALSCGIPVAAHDVMGPGDIVTNGVTGYLSDDLRDAALKSLSLSKEACRTAALQYSWGRSTELFMESLACIGQNRA